MSRSQGCSYKLDFNNPVVDEEKVEGVSVGSTLESKRNDWSDGRAWYCPHRAFKNGLCIFHLPLEEKSDEEVVEALERSLREAKDQSLPEKQMFVGAIFGEIDLDVEGMGYTKKPIYFTYSRFKGGTQLQGEETDAWLDFRGAEFENSAKFKLNSKGKVYFMGAKFWAEAKFDGTFGNRVFFSGGRFYEKAIFKDVAFEENTRFDGVVFSEGFSFNGSVFKGEVDFSNSTFKAGKKKIHFLKTQFFGNVSFEDAEFYGDGSYFLESEFKGGDATFCKMRIQGETTFYNYVGLRNGYFKGAKFEDGVEVDFREAVFGEGVLFDNEFPRIVKFDGAKLSGANLGNIGFDEISLKGTDLRDSNLSNIDLTGVNLKDANLSCSNCEDTVFSRANVQGVDFRGAELKGALFGEAQIDRGTTFLGPPDGGTSNPYPCCVYDLDYDRKQDPRGTGELKEMVDENKAINTYRTLELLSKSQAQPRLQSNCFIRRKEVDRKAISGGLLPLFSYHIMRHGESPKRIACYSMGIIVAFALIFPFGLMKETGPGGAVLTWDAICQDWTLFLQSVYYSVLTFTALGFGDFGPANAMGQVVTMSETIIGVIFIGLFIFVLGRQAER